RYPFLLPNLVVGVVVLLSVPLVLFGLPETLDRNGGVRHKRISASVDEEYVPTASMDIVGLGTETGPRTL
ncbi:unnamed protein product, partial [Ascophyllum nodosum]